MASSADSRSVALPAPRHLFDEGAAARQLLTLTLEPAQALLHLRWAGATDVAAVKRGVVSILQAVHDWHPRLVINDGDRGVGDWQELVPWVAFEIVPQVAVAGVRAAAFLPPASAAGRLALSALLDSAPPTALPMRHFEQEAEARAWLALFTA